MAEETKDSPASETPGTAPTAPARNSIPPESATPAAPPRPAAAKPVTTAATAATANGVSRRGFFSWAAVAWVGFTAAIGGCVTTWGRFMFPNVLFEPPTMFKASKPEEYPAGVVDTR
ncbi:MAG TPA: hypothetical protein VGR07_23735, partial [Thermoanaerobaculia bacterium]|nr:hypothetical protein [Thermoanaerobaculia bacterium]